MKTANTLLAAAVLTVSLAALAATAADKPSVPATERALVERGKYLVNHVALCVDCHSPRDQSGAFVAGAELTGSPLGFAPTVEMPWMAFAPPIAGLPGHYTAEDSVRFLMTGERPGGLPPVLPPMPAYRMNRADAEAVTAYLQSLKPAGTW